MLTSSELYPSRLCGLASSAEVQQDNKDSVMLPLEFPRHHSRHLPRGKGGRGAGYERRNRRLEGGKEPPLKTCCVPGHCGNPSFDCLCSAIALSVPGLDLWSQPRGPLLKRLHVLSSLLKLDPLIQRRSDLLLSRSSKPLI